MAMRLEDVQNSPSSRGRTLYLKYLKGEKLSASQAIIAECFCCNAGWIDGKNDCEMPDCPLYPFQLYGKGNKNKDKVKSTRVISEENKIKMSEGRKSNKEKK